MEIIFRQHMQWQCYLIINRKYSYESEFDKEIGNILEYYDNYIIWILFLLKSSKPFTRKLETKRPGAKRAQVARYFHTTLIKNCKSQEARYK